MEFNATFLVSVISFVLFTLIMNKIFYKPIAKIMAERQKYIDDTLSDAKISSDKANALLKDREDKLVLSLKNSKQKITQSTIETNNEASTIKQEAKLHAKDVLSSAKMQLQSDADELDKNLEPQVETLAKAIAEKIMGVEV